MNAYTPGIERMMKRLFDSLRENDRRRYAAIEATKLGHGGVEYIAQRLGVRSQDHSTGTDGTGRGGRPGHRTCPKKTRMANLTGEAQESTNFYGKRSLLLAVCATK